MAVGQWFYRSDEEWDTLAERLKLTACPHCQVVGTLIRPAVCTVNLQRQRAGGRQ